MDRRTHNRVPRRALVTSACGHIDGRTTNISEGGFHLQNMSATPLRVGSTYSLRLHLGSDSFEVQAEVISSQSDVFYETGALRFTDINTAVRQQIRQLTNKVKPKAPRKVGLGRVALVQRPIANRDSIDRIG